MIILCKACGTSYEVNNGHPTGCKICQDERQYVPVAGQAWVPLEWVNTHHDNKWRQILPGLFSIQTVPEFAIGQRAFIITTPMGNILWDCIANLDDATRSIINRLGGLAAIAISHPHYYTTMQDWAEEFNAPVYLHTDDQEWVVRPNAHLRFWEGEALQISDDVQLLRLGGHFAGGCVLHDARGAGTLLTGDVLQVTPGADRVSFMRSFPNYLPLPETTVRQIAIKLKNLNFDAIYGAFEGKDIPSGAASIVQQSAQKYVECLSSR